MLAGNILDAVVPKLLVVFVAHERHHRQCLVASLAWAHVHTVAATEAVHHIDHLHKLQSRECLAYCGQLLLVSERRLGCLLLGHEERAYCCVGAHKGTLVALDAVLSIPCGDKGGNTALLPG